MTLVCEPYLFIYSDRSFLTSGTLLCEEPLLWLKVTGLRPPRPSYKGNIKKKMSVEHW